MSQRLSRVPLGFPQYFRSQTRGFAAKESVDGKTVQAGKRGKHFFFKAISLEFEGLEANRPVAAKTGYPHIPHTTFSGLFTTRY